MIACFRHLPHPGYVMDASARPAERRRADGSPGVDPGAIIRLATPLFLNSALQAALNLTDTWFLGRISTEATAAVGAVYWFVIVTFLLPGGVGMAVQTLSAHAYGAGDRHAAGAMAWGGWWCAVAMLPFFVVLALAGPVLIGVLGLPESVGALAAGFWEPRMLGGTFAVALWSLTGFFNGIGRARVTFAVMVVVAVVNAGLNALFVLHLGWGVAGSAWATSLALACGCASVIGLLLRPGVRAAFGTATGWRPDTVTMRRLAALGLPMGLFTAADVIGLALFQAMQAKTGATAGAATQIVMMLTSIAFMPAVGIGLAGTTLVGQAIGAGDRDWAARLGNAVIVMAVGYMTVVGVVVALFGSWLMAAFTSPLDPQAGAVIELGVTLLWIAAAYQFFDGLNLGAGFCLRGAGDVRLPTAALLVLSWALFMPLCHALTFAPGEGWVRFLPQYGLGAVGGWVAALAYTFVLGTMLLLRWRSGAWRRVRLRH
jgi:MATE family multidrug resistance protein